MRIRLICLLILAAVPRLAYAQDDGVHVALTGAALVDWHPADESYVGAPYLDRAFGGFGPGVLAGINVRLSRFVIDGEFTSARIEVVQSGRIAGGEAVETRSHDSMLTGLIGARLGSGRTTADLLGGVSL